MWIAFAAVIGGLVLLVFSADRFVDAAASAAQRLGVSALIVGLTVVAFGTSAPEVTVSILASLQGNTGIAIGNAIGSNIANIGLIIGIAAMITPLIVAQQLVRRELPILLAVSVLAFALLLDGQLSRLDGVVLIAGMMGFLIWLGYAARRGDAAVPIPHAATPHTGPGSRPGSEPSIDVDINRRSDGTDTKQSPVVASAVSDHAPSPTTSGGSLGRDFLWIVVGLVLLIIASRMLVWGAVEIAEALGIPEIIIGLTIVAIGTSLPELATSIAAAIKQQADIAVGNIVGSNIFNTLLVLPVAGLIAPGAVDRALLTRDLPWMLALTVALVLFAWIGVRARNRARQISRIEGALLLIAFIGYLGWLVFGVIAA